MSRLMGEQHKERCQWTMGFAWGNPFLFVALTNRARARLVSEDEFEDEDDWVARSWSKTAKGQKKGMCYNLKG